MWKASFHGRFIAPAQNIHWKACNTLKKHVLTIILFYFFVCDDLSFITTTQKTLKPSKNLLIPRMDEKKMSYPGISAEGYQQKHKMQVASKKGYWKNNRVFQALVTYCHWKIFSQNLADAFFKYLKIIFSYLFQKYSLCWYYAVLIFTLKLRDPSPQQHTPPPSWRGWGRGCMPCKVVWDRKIIT